MASERYQETEISRYGPSSSKIQATQTLPVQTQPPTQLMSHEVHQFTQLINHDAGEHVHVDTMVNDSELEVSGDTIILHDDDDDVHEGAQSGPPLKGKDEPPLQDDAQLTPPLDIKDGFAENGLHSNVIAEHHGVIDAHGLAPHVGRDLPDSDATTEEEDAENIGYLDTDAESRPAQVDNTVDIEGAKVGEKSLAQPDLPGVVDIGNNTQDNLALQETPEMALVADVNGTKSSQSRPRSIASVHAASLRASGLRAASRNASQNSAGKDDVKFDSDATVELASGMRDGELQNPLEVPEAELHGIEDPHTKNTADFDPMQLSPKATLLIDDTTLRSPRMSTSRSKSKSVSAALTSLHHTSSEQDNRGHMDFDATTESNTGRVPEKPKTSIDQPESMSAPLESLSLGLKRLHSEASFASSKKLDPEVGANDVSLGVNVKVQSRQPSSQKARKLFFDHTETAPITTTDKLEDGERDAVSKGLETEHVNVLKKPTSVIHAVARERQCYGYCAVSANLSYLESQEPGEESQLNALNMVDKLVWLDATCMSDDIVTSPLPHDGSLKNHAGAKGLQSLAQAAQMKTVHDKLDVFDWEDSQLDEDVSPDIKQGTVNVRARKRQPEAHKPMLARKKQATSHERKTEYTPQIETKAPASVEKEKSTPDVGKKKVSNGEHSSGNHPHAFFTTRLRNRTKAELSSSGKGRKSPSLKSEPRKQVGKRKQSVESGNDFETGQQKGIEEKVQQAGPTIKRELKKQVGKKKLIDNPGKDLEIEQQKGGDNKERSLPQADSLSAKSKKEPLKDGKVQRAGPTIKSELKKQVGKKKLIDNLGEDLEIEQQKGGDNKERRLPEADSLSAKSKKEPLKTFEADPGIHCNLGLADRTSQDDAAADMWIEAFASSRNKTPMGSSVEVIKFRKRSALHEDSGKDSRITEPATVNEEQQDKSEMEEIPMQEDRVEPGLKIQQDSDKSKNVDAATISRHKGRRVSTRRSQGEEDTQKTKVSLMKEQLVDIRPEVKHKLKKPRVADTLTVKGRRVSTRNRQGEHQDAFKVEENLIGEDKAESVSKTRHDSKQYKTVDVAITPSVKSRGVSTRGKEVEHVDISGQAENAREDALLERVSKTRSKAQDVKSRVIGRDAKRVNRTKKAVIKNNTTQATGNVEDGPSLSTGIMQADNELEKPSSRAGRSKKRSSSVSYQPLTAKSDGDTHEIKADSCMVKSFGLSSAPTPINGNEGAPAGGPRRTKRRREAADAVSTEARKNPLSQSKEDDTDKFSPKIKELGCFKKGDISSMTLRRTRSSTGDGGSQKNDSVDAEKEGVHIRGGPITEEQILQNYSDNLDAKKGLKKQVAKSATKSTPRRNKKTASLEVLGNLHSSSLIDEGRRRKRESGCIHVLFSHSLTEDAIKHQKKILAKLGGHLATSASDCTHFVANGFVRTRNMLMSMAAGKIVATPLWLESCGQAHYFVDEKNYILQDEKKERELGFSMIASLAAARRTPLLKGVKVLVCPNTVPEPAVLKAIVESAGGEVLYIKAFSSQLDAKESDTLFVIIANEKDFDFCRQFLDKGLKVYSEELVLHGIVTQTLDFSRNHLFEDFKQQKGPRRVANING